MDGITIDSEPIHYEVEIEILENFGGKLDKIISKFDLSKYMNFVISGEEVNNSKPDPEIFLPATKKMNVKPEDCLVIGYATNGVKAANMKCIVLKILEQGNQYLSDADFAVNN